MKEILENHPDKKTLLLGNEALVRGALEAGVQYVSTYPGTPASEIGNTFSEIAKEAGIYFEFSSNERTALEGAMGASFSGLKTLVAMKNFGLNVCADPLFTFLYMGSRGPTVIAVGDDPGCWSSAESEQNSRGFSLMTHLPALEPADPSEMKEFTKLAFELSEKYKLPVMVRFTTRVAHQKMPVSLGKLNLPKSVNGQFIKNPRQLITLPPRVLEMKSELMEKIKKLEREDLNQASGRKGKSGIIASGVSYLYVKEALNFFGDDLPILKINLFYPLAEKQVKDFIKGLSQVLIVEELDPYLEKEVERLAKEVNPKLEISGKNLLPEVGEIRPENVFSAVSRLIKKNYQVKEFSVPKEALKRYPNFCQGCYYRLVFAAIKKVISSDTVLGGDIGCYMIASFPNQGMSDYLSSMGSSLGIAHGISKAGNKKIIAFMGDSTFFHTGLSSLVNIVFNNSNVLLVILDNSTTAMTGHQTNPGIGKNGMGDEVKSISIEKLIAAMGIENLKIIDPINSQEMESTVKEFLEKSGPSVIIARRTCWLLSRKNAKRV